MKFKLYCNVLNSYVLNFILIQATDFDIPAAQKTLYQKFAVDQMEYILTKTGRRWKFTKNSKSLWTTKSFTYNGIYESYHLCIRNNIDCYWIVSPN